MSKEYKYAFDKYKTFSDLIKNAKLHPKVLKAAKLLAEQEQREMEAWMALTPAMQEMSGDDANRT